MKWVYSIWDTLHPSTILLTCQCSARLCRGESLDGLDSSWRSSWAPRTNNSYAHNLRPHSALSGHSTAYGGAARAPRPQSTTLPSSYSMSSLGGGAGTPSTNWSQQSRSSSASSPSPTNSPEPPHQRNR